MIQINKAILHVLDFEHNKLDISQQVMGQEELNELGFARKQIERLIQNPNMRKAEFSSSSIISNDFKHYLENNEDLQALSMKIANEWFRLIKLSNKIENSYLLAADCYDNEKHLLVFMKYKCRNIYISNGIKKDGQVIDNVLERVNALPGSSSIPTECFIVNVDTLDVYYRDLLRVIETKETYIIADRLLNLNSNLSQKEIISSIKDIVEDISDTYELNALEKVVKTKSYIQDKISDDGYLRIDELAEELFPENHNIANEFKTNTQEKEIPSDVFLNLKYADNISKIQKLKTDSGIIINLPSIYFEDKEHFEIIQNEDNTMTLQIKNVVFIK